MSMMHKKTARMKQKSLKERTREKKEAIVEKERKKNPQRELNPLRGLLASMSSLREMNAIQKGDGDNEKKHGSSLTGQSPALGRPTLGIVEEGGSEED